MWWNIIYFDKHNGIVPFFPDFIIVIDNKFYVVNRRDVEFIQLLVMPALDMFQIVFGNEDVGTLNVCFLCYCPFNTPNF